MLQQVTPDIEEIYGHHASALFAFSLNLSRSESISKDLIQDVFCQIAARPGLLDGVANVRAWMIRAVYRRYVDLVRRREVRERFATTTQPLFAKAEDPDEAVFRQALDDAMADLPEEQRSVVYLKVWEGLTFLEIAEALDISPNTAGSRYRYGIDKLRDVLRPVYDELS